MRVKGFGNLFIFSFSSLFGVLLWFSLPGEYLEKNVGLNLLSYLRESKPPPAEALVIPINKESADELGEDFSSNFKGWKRSNFAKVVDTLSDAGVSVIVIDVFFKQKSITNPIDDLKFTQSLSKAGNVILLKGHSDRKETSETNTSYNLEQQGEVYEAFRRAAYSTAHSVLEEKSPIKTNFSTFPTITQRTLPNIFVVALHLYYSKKSEQWDECIKEIDKLSLKETEVLHKVDNIEHRLSRIHKYINDIKVPLTRDNTHAECGDQELAWLESLFRSKPLRHFNIYDKLEDLEGPSFYKLAKSKRETNVASLKGKVVFIGLSEKKRTDVSDILYYLGVNGKGESRINGVDLQAISFLNLLHNDDIKKINGTFAIILLLSFGIIFTLIGYLLKPAVALICMFTLCIGYSYITVYAIDSIYVWMPFIIPLFIQAPLGISAGLEINNKKIRHKLTEVRVKLSEALLNYKEAYNIAQKLKEFISPTTVKSIEQKGYIDTTPHLFHAVCLHSDIKDYTSLSEKFSQEPLKLKFLEIEYWELVHEQIGITNGERLEIAGDGMTCIWKEDTCKNPYLNAYQASIGIIKAIEQFNRKHPQTPFITRLGIHVGNIPLGPIGRKGQYTLAAGGIIISIAARLEDEVNKLLGTQLLASEHLISVLPDKSDTRYVGNFIGSGMTTLIKVYEIYSGEVEMKSQIQLKFSMFGKALQTLQLGDITTADRLFREILDQFPDDGPSKFYRKLIAIYSKEYFTKKSNLDFQVINLDDQTLRARLLML